MSDDLIKRSDAIKAVRKSKWWHFCDLIPVLSAIKDIPTADRPKGEWIGNNLDGTFKVWDCSECGIHMEIRWNFCPNCGADMRGESDE